MTNMSSRIGPQLIDCFGKAIIDKFDTISTTIFIHDFTPQKLIMFLKLRKDVNTTDHIVARFDVQCLKLQV